MKPQCDQLLRSLKRGPMTTGEIRSKLGISMPATRIFELKEEGHNIVTELTFVRNRYGDHVRVARYRLIRNAGKVKQAA